MKIKRFKNATFYCADNRVIIDKLKFDAIITDPPYGINHPCAYKKRGRGKLAQCKDYPDVYGDDMPFNPDFWLAFNVPTLFWGANYFADKLPVSSGWLVWDKKRPDTLDQATCELAWTNYVKGVRRLTHLWHGFRRASEQRENYHPTQKPVAIMEWALSFKWSPRGVILDPYMGAGSTALACKKLGLKFIGIEISQEYFDIACERYKKA